MLLAKEELFKGKDVVSSLDVSILQDYLLFPVLGIKDPRTDPRISFIGGIRGLDELEKRAGKIGFGTRRYYEHGRPA